jgi:hypothetical protein
VADITPCGIVTVIGLKKCGSSQIRKSFAEKHWQWQQFPETPLTQRYVTAFRNPAHRLVSCWNHLVRAHVERGGPHDPQRDVEKFGPRVDFPEWCEWLISTDPETMNAHMRPQTYELADVLRDKDGLIWIMQLERATEICKGPLTDWMHWSCSMPDKQRHPYAKGLWTNYYPPGLLTEVRRFYRTDYNLWISLFTKGYEVLQTRALSRTLDLTNGRDSCML